MAKQKISLLEISYKNGDVEAHGRLFINDDGKFEFGGDAEESAKVFFEHLKLMCNECIKKWDKERYPLFSWKENV